MPFLSPNTFSGTSAGELIRFTPGEFLPWYSIQAWAGGGHDLISMPFHNALIFGGEGSDRLTFAPADQALVVDLAAGVAFQKADFFLNGRGGPEIQNPTSRLDYVSYESIETLFTTNFSDVVRGSAADSGFRLYLQGGNDRFEGGNGNDWADGGTGTDTMLGGAGDDRLYGGSGDDFLFGGDGEDTLNGGFGNDSLNGGDQADVLSGYFGSDSLHGGQGNDQLRGGFDADWLFGDAGVDDLWGGQGADHFVFSFRDPITDVDTGDIFEDRADTIHDFDALDTIHIPSGRVFADAGNAPGMDEYSVWQQDDHFVVSWRTGDGAYSDVRVFGEDPTDQIVADWTLVI